MTIELLLYEFTLDWTIGKVLDAMLESISSLEESLDEKLDRLINSPYETGKNALALAVNYQRHRNYELQKHQLERAKDCFDQAGSQLKNLEQIHSYCLASICCKLLEDDVGNKHFLSLALKKLSQYKSDNAYGKDYKNNNVNTVVGGTMGGIVGLQAAHLAITFLVPALAPLALLGGVAGAFAGSKNASYLSNRNVKLNDTHKHLPGFGCSLSQLETAIINGLSS